MRDLVSLLSRFGDLSSVNFRVVSFCGIPLKNNGQITLFGPEQGFWLQHDLRRVVLSSQAS